MGVGEIFRKIPDLTIQEVHFNHLHPLQTLTGPVPETQDPTSTKQTFLADAYLPTPGFVASTWGNDLG